MDKTRDLVTEHIEEAVGRAVPGPSRRSLPEALDATLGKHGSDFQTLAATVLEQLLETLDFERGFFLLEGSSPVEEPRAAATGSGDHPDLRVVACRWLYHPKAGVAEWKNVESPEFAFNASVVRRAVASPEALAINDCLVQPGPGNAEQHRAVLCHSTVISPGVRAVVYADRGLGRDGIDEASRMALKDVMEAAAAALGRAHLLDEVRELRERIRGTDGKPDGEDADDDTESAALDDAAEVTAFHGIVGKDAKLRKIFEVVEKVKDSDLNVCIFGESGTGKELVARSIHEAGNRREYRFVSENCGAIAENLLESELFGHVKGAFTGADEDRKGLFELADRGTLFLDEIGDMSEGMQRKLLRALQEGTIRPIGGKQSTRVDVRVVCASNRDLKLLVKEGSFRADLYYRLNVIQIHVPPLRERREDIPLLVRHFAALMSQEDGVRGRFSESAIKAMTQYSWPGNVRELRNVVRRAMLTSTRRVIVRKTVLPLLTSAEATACLGENLERDQNHLLLRIPSRSTFSDLIDECERLILLNALRENGWNKSRVTKALGIPRQSLYNKIAKHSLSREAEPSTI